MKGLMKVQEGAFNPVEGGIYYYGDMKRANLGSGSGGKFWNIEGMIEENLS